MKLLKRRVEKGYEFYTELVQERAEVIYLYSDIEINFPPLYFWPDFSSDFCIPYHTMDQLGQEMWKVCPENSFENHS